MELLIADKKIELRDIVYLYAPVFTIAFSGDDTRQVYVIAALGSLENSYENDEQLHENIFSLLDHFLHEAGKGEQFSETVENLKVIYNYLKRASEPTQSFLKIRSPNNDNIYEELSTIKETLEKEGRNAAAGLLANIIQVYKEDSTADFLSNQMNTYNNVLKEIADQQKDMENFFK